MRPKDKKYTTHIQIYIYIYLWMSQEISKWLVNGLFHLLINGVYWGYNPLTNLLLTSWDIQVLVDYSSNRYLFSTSWDRFVTSPSRSLGPQTHPMEQYLVEHGPRPWGCSKTLNFRLPKCWVQFALSICMIWAIHYKSLTWIKAFSLGPWATPLGRIPLLNYLLGWPRLRSL